MGRQNFDRGGPVVRLQQECSGCGTAKAKLPHSERTYACTACGLVLDRDMNAAKNLAALASTGELRQEQPDGTGIRRGRPAARAVGIATGRVHPDSTPPP
ncbi:zinc ribbon domain-containing protein [Nocardia sp. NPDC059246]|uniref:zinc ribbon domain-containing protein n=1 Tax=unclassified Nocardia TaxID=2637762 RepID=UPI003678FE9C